MAESSGPFDGGPGQTLVEADWELMLQELVDGVVGTPPSTALGATATGTRQTAIAAGTALARGHWYRNTSTITLTSSANAAGSDRVDRAVLRLDRSANTVTTALITGTAGAGTPALTNTATVTDRPLWRWTVKPGATSISGLTDERQWLGSVVRPCTSANRPASGKAGQLAVEVDTGRLIRHDGSGWQLVTDDTGWVDLAVDWPTAWTALGECSARRKNGTVHVIIQVQRKGAYTRADPDGTQLVTLPAGMRPIHHWEYFPGQVNAGAAGGVSVRLQVRADGTVWLDHPHRDFEDGDQLRASFNFVI